MALVDWILDMSWDIASSFWYRKDFKIFSLFGTFLSILKKWLGYHFFRFLKPHNSHIFCSISMKFWYNVRILKAFKMSPSRVSSNKREPRKLGTRRPAETTLVHSLQHLLHRIEYWSPFGSQWESETQWPLFDLPLAIRLERVSFPDLTSYVLVSILA